MTKRKDPVDYAIHVSKGNPPAFDNFGTRLDKQLVENGLWDFEVKAGLQPAMFNCLSKQQLMLIVANLPVELHCILNENDLTEFRLTKNPITNSENILKMKKVTLINLLNVIEERYFEIMKKEAAHEDIESQSALSETEDTAREMNTESKEEYSDTEKGCHETTDKITLSTASSDSLSSRIVTSQAYLVDKLFFTRK